MAATEYCFFPGPLINEHLELNKIAGEAVIKQMGEKSLVHLDKMMSAEDFPVYMEKTPGVYGFHGARNKDKGICCVHHHPDFDVDEDVLPDGADIYAQFAVDFLAATE